MTDDTFDIDAIETNYQARLKAAAAKRDIDRAKMRDRFGELLVATGVANKRTLHNVAGLLLWAAKQAVANPALNKEWDRLGTTFLGKSRAAKPGASNNDAGDSDTCSAGDAKPAPAQKPDGQADAGARDLLTRGAAE